MSKSNPWIRRTLFLVFAIGALEAAFCCYHGRGASGFFSTVAAQVEPYVDDGRYDYGLSQPNPDYQVKLESNVDIPMPDGTILKGDVFRPDAPGRFPVIMGQAFFPRIEMPVGTGVDDIGGVQPKYQRFEQPLPDYWIPRGYI